LKALHMLDGQADSAPDAGDDLVDFLVDNQEADEKEDSPNSNDAPDSSDPALTETDEDSPAADDSDETDESDDAKQTSGLKFKFTVPGEDGKPVEVELDEKGVKESYLRHADYTRKTQELATRTRDVDAAAIARVQEGQTFYIQQAQLAHAAIGQLAGLRNENEMAQLAQTDPAAWVAESQRQSAIRGVLGQLEQGMKQEQTRAQELQKQQQKAAFDAAWAELGGKGIDKPTLVKIYSSVTEEYGISADVLGTVYDPKVVQVMRDAVAYRELLKRKGAVTKQVKEAPRLPAARQRVPEKEQANKKLNARFRSGNAGLNDLASFIGNND